MHTSKSFPNCLFLLLDDSARLYSDINAFTACNVCHYYCRQVILNKKTQLTSLIKGVVFIHSVQIVVCLVKVLQNQF